MVVYATIPIPPQLVLGFFFEMKTPISQTHLIDCIDYMKQFPDKHFELAVVDPPYGIGFSDYQRGSSGEKVKKRYTKSGKKQWDSIVPTEWYFSELKRVSVNQIIWGANYFLMPPSKHFIFWYKRNPVPNFADGEFAWTSFDKPAVYFDYMYYGNINSEIDRIHPTQKPVALYKWIFAKYAKQGDKILDTHLGSQSSRIAAYEMGFDFYGCELDHEYFEQGNKRFEAWRKMNGQQLFDFNDFVI